MDNFLRIYCRMLEAVTAVCLALMVLLVFGNVVLRYVFNSGIAVSEEMSRWLFVWLTFLGGIVALREHAHLGTEILVARLSATGKKLCLLLAYALMLMICWMVFSGALEQTRINWDVSAPSSGASMAWFYGAGLVFSVSAACILLNDIFRVVTGRVSEAELIMIKESEDQP